MKWVVPSLASSLLALGLVLLAACKEKPPPAPVKIAIAVTDEGYTPAHIEVARGQQVTLAFTRTTTSECLEKVVIPSQSVEKPLPVGQEVDITFTPVAKGEMPFACGMGMFHGLVVVK